MSKPRRVGLLVNERAGTAGTNAAEQVRNLLVDRGIDVLRIDMGSGRSLPDLVREALEADCDSVVAGGGDGTVNAVASSLVGTNARLGVLPLGTLNHFAKDLKIPLDIEQAVAVIADGWTTPVDVGEVNGRTFVNNSSLGLYPAIVRLRENLQANAGYGKWRAFLQATLAILVHFPRLRLELHPPNAEPIRTKAPLLFIGNNSYETGLLTLGTRMRLDEGRLWIVLPEAATRWRMMMLLIALWRGVAERTDDLTVIQSDKLVVRSRKRRLRVATDGEVAVLKPPLRYRIHRRALNVLAPRPRSLDAT